MTITSEDEQDVIMELLEDNYLQREGYWIGGINEDEWKWVTGQKFNFTYFAAGEPNKSGNYLQIYKNGYWDDTTEDGTGNSSIREHGFICEWDSKKDMSK